MALDPEKVEAMWRHFEALPVERLHEGLYSREELAQTAARIPELRRLFPFTSVHRLFLSRNDCYPWEAVAGLSPRPSERVAIVRWGLTPDGDEVVIEDDLSLADALVHLVARIRS